MIGYVIEFLSILIYEKNYVTKSLKSIRKKYIEFLLGKKK